MTKISHDEITLLSKYIFQISGIHLDQRKGYLLENRLKNILKSESCSTYTELHNKALSDTSQRLAKVIIDAISTNETYFFRDNTPFDLMKNKIIPDFIDNRSREFRPGPIPIRIWSAACSTGQEVYSIIITLIEMLPDPNKLEIFVLGTDISDQAVAQASYGKYNQFEVGRGLPAGIRQKYFTKSGSDWRIIDRIRSMAKFEKINLIKPFQDIGKFDLVFCRNVAIYFDQPNKIKLFRKIASVLKPDGSLLVGGSESLTGITTDFVSRQYLRGIFYQLRSFTQQTEPQKNQKVTTTQRLDKLKSKIGRRVRKQAYAAPPRADQKDKTVDLPPKPQVPTQKSKKTRQEKKFHSESSIDSTPAAITPQKLRSSLSKKTSDTGTQKEKKKSLLSALKSKQTKSPLITSPKKEKQPKASLLEKIALSNKKKKS